MLLLASLLLPYAASAQNDWYCAEGFVIEGAIYAYWNAEANGRYIADYSSEFDGYPMFRQQDFGEGKVPFIAYYCEEKRRWMFARDRAFNQADADNDCKGGPMQSEPNVGLKSGVRLHEWADHDDDDTTDHTWTTFDESDIMLTCLKDFHCLDGFLVEGAQYQWQQNPSVPNGEYVIDNVKTFHGQPTFMQLTDEGVQPFVGYYCEPERRWRFARGDRFEGYTGNKRVRWEENGQGGCTDGNWFKIGTAQSLDEAKALMLDHPECSKPDSMLFYAAYSDNESWSVRCALNGDHQNCQENNPNWQEYILRVADCGGPLISRPRSRLQSGVEIREWIDHDGNPDTIHLWQSWEDSTIDLTCKRDLYCKSGFYMSGAIYSYWNARTNGKYVIDRNTMVNGFPVFRQIPRGNDVGFVAHYCPKPERWQFVREDRFDNQGQTCTGTPVVSRQERPFVTGVQLKEWADHDNDSDTDHTWTSWASSEIELTCLADLYCTEGFQLDGSKYHWTNAQGNGMYIIDEKTKWGGYPTFLQRKIDGKRELMRAYYCPEERRWRWKREYHFKNMQDEKSDCVHVDIDASAVCVGLFAPVADVAHGNTVYARIDDIEGGDCYMYLDSVQERWVVVEGSWGPDQLDVSDPANDAFGSNASYYLTEDDINGGRQCPTGCGGGPMASRQKQPLTTGVDMKEWADHDDDPETPHSWQSWEESEMTLTCTSAARGGFVVTEGHQFCKVDENGCISNIELEHEGEEHCEFYYYGQALLLPFEFNFPDTEDCADGGLTITRTADGNEDEVHCGTELDVGIVDKRTNFMYHSASPAGSEVGFTLCANKWNEEE